MRVILDPQVLQPDAVDSVALLAVIHQCREGDRHYLRASENDVRQWLVKSKFPQNVGNTVNAVLKAGDTQKFRSSNSPREIRVGAGKSSWCATNKKGQHSPLLHPRDAVRLLQAPLRLLVENARNDGSFLVKMSQGGQRDDLQRAIDRGWVVFEHAGGVNELEKILNEIGNLDKGKADSWVRWLRLWVMFDRDVDPADWNEPSSQTEKTRLAFEQLRAKVGTDWPGGRRLDRRAIENYLPRLALKRYAELQQHADRRSVYNAVLNAYYDVQLGPIEGPDPLRAYYSMHNGFKKKEKNEQGVDVIRYEVPTLYSDKVDSRVMDALKEGFSKGVKDIWNDKLVKLEDQWIARERTHQKNQEISTLIDDILERI